jgi:hypothetical protein
MAIVLVCGALVGAGAYLVLRAVLPAAPALGPALQRLTPPLTATTSAAPTSGDSAVARWLTDRVSGVLQPPAKELALIGQSLERYVLQKVGYPLFGLLFPPLVALLFALLGVRPPIAVPAVVSLVLAVLLFVLVDVSVREQATDAREEFSRSVAVYLDLVALERAASHGPVESLERAAKASSHWVFARISAALDGARYANVAPWEELRRLADEVGVPELGDVGDIMRLSGTEGAQVYQTLVSRAASLRVALRTKEADRANTATTLLYIPTSLTVFVLFLLAGYPFLLRLVTS